MAEGEDIPQHVEEKAVHGEGGEPGVHLHGEGAEVVPDVGLEPGMHGHLAAGPGKHLQAFNVGEHVLEILRPVQMLKFAKSTPRKSSCSNRRNNFFRNTFHFQFSISQGHDQTYSCT